MSGYWLAEALNKHKFEDRAPKMTVGHIATIRAWLLANGYQNTLYLERVDGRNLIYLRITILGGPVSFEAAWLNSIHRKLTSPESIRKMLEQKATETIAIGA